MTALPRARTYNQSHVARPDNGGRRISIYWTWSYPWESQRDPAQIYNRFSTITEVHNIAWPAYEAPEYDAAHFLQGIAGDTRTLSSVDAVVPGARRGGHRPASVQAWSSMAAIARSMAAVRVITNENCAPCRTHAATTARLP